MNRILVVVDMQNDFITGSLGTPEAQVIVPKVVEKAKSFDGTIYVTQDTHYDDYLETQEGKVLPIIHCVKNSDGHNIYDKLEQVLIDKNAIKIIKDTFSSIELANTLSSRIRRGASIDEIELCGLCTDICVVSNALLLKAFLPEVKIVVDSSCCAGVTPEKHEAALEVMRSCQIEVI